MRLELQADLFQRYPLLFRQPGARLISGPGEEPYLREDDGPIDYYGVECGDGWLSLIERLAALCEVEIHSMMMRSLPKEVWPRCVQVKEKFGGLRFYVQGELSEPTRTAINAAEQESTMICEVCGNPAELRRDQHYRLTLCDICTATREAADFTTDWTAHDQYLLDIRNLLASRPK